MWYLLWKIFFYCEITKAKDTAFKRSVKILHGVFAAFLSHQCKHKKLEDNELGGDKFNNEYVTHLAWYLLVKRDRFLPKQARRSSKQNRT